MHKLDYQKEESPWQNKEPSSSGPIRPRAQIPVTGATVAVTHPSAGGKHLLVALRVTDESGHTQPVTLPTPPAAESEHPGTAAPYTLCDLWVEHPDFQMLHMENVQIFSGVETLQDAELLPLPEFPEQRDMTRIVHLTSQPL